MKTALGKGLGALLTSANNEESGVLEIKINEIEPNKNQPRKNFNDEKLTQLSESIKQHGIVQPIIVNKEGEIYRIVAGERRWRAARIAGLATVPVIVKDITNKQVMEIALIENIQREDLNAIEEAEAYKKLIEEYKMTQEDLSLAVGKSRSAIANSMRLLTLDDIIKAHLISGELTSGHARALLSVDNKQIQAKLANEVITKNLNVRDTEKLVKRFLLKKPVTNSKIKNEQFVEIEEKLKNIFGTKVELMYKNKKGKIMIEYYSNEELDRILELVENIGN